MNAKHCPICTTGELAFFQEPDELQYKGQTYSVDVEYAICQQCGEEMILPEQIRRNDCRARDVWRKADGLLTGKEIVALRKKLELTQQEASQMFGGGPNAFSKYERGEVIQSVAMDKLMRLALEKQPVNVTQWLSDHAGLQTEIPQAGYGKIIPFKPKPNPLPTVATNAVEPYQELNHG
jgi:putative zinc finger/helix-turn-helix YgiT family protein